MGMNNYAVMIEPEFDETYWCDLCIQGIKAEVARNKGSFRRVYMEDVENLRDIAAGERPLLILVGSLVGWMSAAVKYLGQMGIHCILVTAPVPELSLNVSTISMDYHHAFDELVCHLKGLGRERIALLGVYPNSVNDQEKLKAYQESAERYLEGKPAVYLNYGQINQTCRNFGESWEKYDAVICTNDILAIRLKDFLQEHNVQVPQQIYLATLGETRLAHLVRPEIAAATLDFESIGKHAVRIYRMLYKNPDLTQIHAKVYSSIHAGEERQAKIPAEWENEKTFQKKTLAEKVTQGFYEDQEVRSIFLLENLISHCLAVDFTILRGLDAGKQYSVIAEETFLAENTVKYRIRRMMDLAGCSDKNEMLQLVKKYLKMEDLPRE